MSIDFSTLQGLTIPDGVVTQITDASGRVIWAVQSNKPVVLGVEKQTLTTYANETTYENEEFVLLDIYPKTASSIVNVTYGGLTKTLTFNGTNSQQVYFGTFNGVSDSVETPASGELVIEGGYRSFAVGTYKFYNTTSSKTNIKYCSCITNVVEWGDTTNISPYAFYNCANLAITSLPSGITSIPNYAFFGCINLPFTSLPEGITSIGDYALGMDVLYGTASESNLALTSLPSTLKSIGSNAFRGCTKLALTELPSGVTSIGSDAFYGCDSITLSSLPIGVTSIPDQMLTYCDNITNFTIHAGVTSIGYYALLCADYYGAEKLSIVTILATTPPTLKSVMSSGNTYYLNFGRVEDKPNKTFTIIVPKGCASAYKADETWIAAGYVDYITEAS